MKKKNVQALLVGMSVMMSVILPVTPALAADSSHAEKEQTVYVNADENGNSKEVIVSNWLKNTGNEKNLTDKSNLTDIENVKGDETCEQNPDGNLTWNTDGGDIYYQGTTNKELPVSVKLTYYLDGKEMKPEDLAGKSGKIKIRIEYKNKEKKTEEVNGKKEEIYTPFLMMTAMILPADTFTNVEMTNGKVLSDGNNDIAVGYGIPGLSDSLKLSDMKELKDLEIPEYAELTADVKDFSLGMTATVATTGLLEDFNLDDVKDSKDLKEKLDTLTDSSTALVKGSKDLQEGIATLDSSADTFVNGLNSADEGAGQLKDGIDTMNNSKGELLDGITRLTEGMGSLESGAGTLKEGISAYTQGASKLGEGISQTAEGAEALDTGIGTLNEKKDTLTEGVGQLSMGGQQLAQGTGQLEKGGRDYTAGAERLDEGIGMRQEQLASAEGAPPGSAPVSPA